MVLIQLLLPTTHGGEEQRTRTRTELVERFGGITAYVQTPALGEWTTAEGQRQRDQVVMVEVVAPDFDRTWWQSYARTLADRFGQQAIHLRALPVEMLDPDAA